MTYIPYSHLLVALNPPIHAVQRYKACKRQLRVFKETLFAHLQRLDAAGQLHPHGLGQAVMDLSKLPGVTIEDVQEDIYILFIAGRIAVIMSLCFGLLYANSICACIELYRDQLHYLSAQFE